MPEFTLASLRIVCFSLYYHLVVFICNSPNRKEAGKKTRTGKNSACVFPAACTVPFPITFTATHRVPNSPHVPVLQPVPTDVPGAPERSQRPRFTARMHSNAGRTRIKISNTPAAKEFVMQLDLHLPLHKRLQLQVAPLHALLCNLNKNAAIELTTARPSFRPPTVRGSLMY